MEPRIITIVSTSTQSKKVINSSATTLRELKADLDNAGISYADMAFYEGLSKTELHSDDSLLPTNVSYKGTVTNNLVFMLTNANKKIKSGMDRKEAYAYIKEHNLSKVFTDTHYKNYTNAPTVELVDFVLEQKIQRESPLPVENCCEQPQITSIATYLDAIQIMAQIMLEKCWITDDIYNAIEKVCNEKINEKKVASIYTDNEIDEMFEDFV